MPGGTSSTSSADRFTYTAAPTVTSTQAGVDSISFPAVSSRDVGTLNYEIFRDGGTTPIDELTGLSYPYACAVNPQNAALRKAHVDA